MSDNQPVQATRADICKGLREHYERISMAQCDWASGICHAIDAYEREPDLQAQLAACEKERDALKAAQYAVISGPPNVDAPVTWQEQCSIYEKQFAATRNELEACHNAMDFALGAIHDAIGLEEGLDGHTGEAVCRILVEALEHGSFDKVDAKDLDIMTQHRRDWFDSLAAVTADLEYERMQDGCKRHREALATAQAEVARLTDQQKSLWLRFTVCTSHEDFCNDLDTLITEHDNLESRTARLKEALEKLLAQVLGEGMAMTAAIEQAEQQLAAVTKKWDEAKRDSLICGAPNCVPYQELQQQLAAAQATIAGYRNTVDIYTEQFQHLESRTARLVKAFKKVLADPYCCLNEESLAEAQQALAE